jgi:glycosyltransferase involved in cell wall biosynthesis
MVGGPVPGREGPYEALRQMVGIADPEGRWLIFKGLSSDVAGEIRASTAVVIPSTKPEALSITALEAMAVGRPVVASAIGGLPEVITDGLTGLLVPPGDPAALASAIDRLIRDPGLGPRLVDAARTMLSERFSGVRFAEAWRQLYGDLAGDIVSDRCADRVT